MPALVFSFSLSLDLFLKMSSQFSCGYSVEMASKAVVFRIFGEIPDLITGCMRLNLCSISNGRSGFSGYTGGQVFNDNSILFYSFDII